MEISYESRQVSERVGVMELAKLLGLERSIGFRLLREECGHCKGRGRCHSGQGEGYGISCASCQMAALGEVSAKLVKCEPCEGRGLYVFTIPEGQALERVMLEVLPQAVNQPSIIRVIVPGRQAPPAQTPDESNA